jgi:hypothetical protein
MPTPANLNAWLVAGATLSAIAALLHLAIIAGGGAWYRFFGAGERFAQAADRGFRWPHVVTLGIATVLGAWSVYALSGAGVLPRLPLLPWALLGITSIYLLRGAAILPLLIWARHHATPFAIWSSLICLGFGLIHALGLWQAWPALQAR